MTLPSAIAYMMLNGRLISTPRGHGYGGDVSLPGDYALVYFEDTGRYPQKSRMAKVFVTKGSHNNAIKEFYSSQYGNNDEIFKKVIETYIRDQLMVPLEITHISRKRKSTKSRLKRKSKKCGCK